MFKSVVKVCGSTVKLRRPEIKRVVKCRCSTSALQRELVSLSTHKVGGIRGVAVKCLDITKNSDCEGSLLSCN